MKPTYYQTILFAFLFISYHVNGQSYHLNKVAFNPSVQNEGYYEIPEDLKAKTNTFFSTNYELWNVPVYNGFGILSETDSSANIQLHLGMPSDEFSDTNKQQELAALIAKLFFFTYTTDTSLTDHKKEYISDMFSGYFYGFHAITKKWGEIHNNNKAMISKTEEINNIANWYAELLSRYKPVYGKEVSQANRKYSFLKGIYLAMPLGYRQHVASETYIGNDIPLLLEELNILDDLNKEGSIFKESDLLFKFQETKIASTPLCEEKKEVPTKFSELNEKVRLVYNLKNNCDFQPIHIEINKENPFTIIGRFSGTKKSEDSFELNQIEFKFFEASALPKSIVVSDAWVDIAKSTPTFKVINVSLMNLDDCDSKSCDKRKTRLKQGEVDFNFNDQKIIFPEGAVLDFHIVNLMDIYPNLKEGDPFFPKGHHCNGTIIF